MILSQVASKVGSLGQTISRKTCLVIPKRTMKNWPEVIANVHVNMPQNQEDRLLPAVDLTPTVAPNQVILPLKHPRADIDMRGPERIHNQLIYRQYGIIALGGGALTGTHFTVIRDGLNKFLNTERFFAIWRVDPPWKAVSKKSLGKRGGGGKAKVHHYETPVKAGRVIIEIAGIGEFGEVQRLLKNICNKMPLYSMPISQEIMDNIKAEKIELDSKNYNPFEYRYLLRNNFSNSQSKIYPGEAIWGGTYF